MIKRHISYEIAHDGDSFEVQFEPVDGSEIVSINGDEATVGYLSPSEWDQGYYFDEYDEGEFHNIGDRRSVKYQPMDQDDIIRLVRKNPGRVFWINKYEHSLVCYYRTGGAIENINRHGRTRLAGPNTEPADRRMLIPDQQWDVSAGVALYVAPDDCPDPAAYCDTVMNTYTDWCNGSIYGVVTQKFTRNAEGEWESGESDECWGFIGYEHAESSLKEEMKS